MCEREGGCVRARARKMEVVGADCCWSYPSGGSETKFLLIERLSALALAS